jgi:hypothetical protein
LTKYFSALLPSSFSLKIQRIFELQIDHGVEAWWGEGRGELGAVQPWWREEGMSGCEWGAMVVRGDELGRWLR